MVIVGLPGLPLPPPPPPEPDCNGEKTVPVPCDVPLTGRPTAAVDAEGFAGPPCTPGTTAVAGALDADGLAGCAGAPRACPSGTGASESARIVPGCAAAMLGLSAQAFARDWKSGVVTDGVESRSAPGAGRVCAGLVAAVKAL